MALDLTPTRKVCGFFLSLSRQAEQLQYLSFQDRGYLPKAKRSHLGDQSARRDDRADLDREQLFFVQITPSASIASATRTKPAMLAPST